jgi:hypothetical protein
MTGARERVTADSLLGALMDARAVELELLDGLTDARLLGHAVTPDP